MPWYLSNNEDALPLPTRPPNQIKQWCYLLGVVNPAAGPGVDTNKPQSTLLLFIVTHHHDE